MLHAVHVLRKHTSPWFALLLSTQVECVPWPQCMAVTSRHHTLRLRSAGCHVVTTRHWMPCARLVLVWPSLLPPCKCKVRPLCAVKVAVLCGHTGSNSTEATVHRFEWHVCQDDIFLAFLYCRSPWMVLWWITSTALKRCQKQPSRRCAGAYPRHALWQACNQAHSAAYGGQGLQYIMWLLAVSGIVCWHDMTALHMIEPAA